MCLQQAWSTAQARELAKLERAASRKRCRVDSGYLILRDKMLTVAIYILAGHMAEPAAALAKQPNAKRMRRYPDEAEEDHDADWHSRAQNMYLVASMVAVDMPDTPQEHRLCSEAMQWLAKHRSAAYVERQNVVMGVAPPSSSVLEAFTDAGGTLPDMSARGRRKLLRRFRENCGSFPTRQEMPEAELHTKAGSWAQKQQWMECRRH